MYGILKLKGMNCCGIREIAGIGYYTNVEFLLSDFVELTWGSKINNPSYDPRLSLSINWVYGIFSQAHTLSIYGTRLRDYIQQYDLGGLSETPFNINPNSRNQLKVWMWTIDHNRIKDHFLSQDFQDRLAKREEALHTNKTAVKPVLTPYQVDIRYQNVPPAQPPAPTGPANGPAPTYYELDINGTFHVAR